MSEPPPTWRFRISFTSPVRVAAVSDATCFTFPPASSANEDALDKASFAALVVHSDAPSCARTFPAAPRGKSWLLMGSSCIPWQLREEPIVPFYFLRDRVDDIAPGACDWHHRRPL